MSTTTYASLVRNALNNRRRRPSKIVASLKATMPLRRFDDLSRVYAPWAQELAEVNEHITVRPDEIEAAVQAYEEVAQHLRQALDWPEDATQVSMANNFDPLSANKIDPPGATKISARVCASVDSSLLPA